MKRIATLLLAFCAACGASAGRSVSPSATPPPSSPSIALRPPGEAKIGDRTRCIVSGDEFVVQADSPRVEYEGKTYYFCCPHCPEKFKADPKKYLIYYSAKSWRPATKFHRSSGSGTNRPDRPMLVAIGDGGRSLAAIGVRR